MPRRRLTCLKGESMLQFGREVELADDSTPPIGEFGLASQVGGVWGGEHSYRGFKVGMGHWLENVGIAGFDRMVGFSQPLPLEGPVPAAVPFQFAGDRSGGEVFWATERNRISALVLDPIPGAGGEMATRKDFADLLDLLPGVG